MAQVDVIIPVHNGSKFIDRCIQSVIEQTIEVHSIFVINDGSTDSTQLILEDWAKRDSRITPINLPKCGLSAARNAGIKLCKSEFIAFLDVDDLWVRKKIELQLRIFYSSNSRLGLVYGGQAIIDVEGNMTDGAGKHTPEIRGDVFRSLLQKGNLITGSASNVMIRRDIFSVIGHFDESLSFGEDWDMWIRIAHRYQVDFVNEVTVKICQHSNSMQRTQSFEKALLEFESSLNVLMKHAGTLQWTKGMIRRIHRLGFKVWRLAEYDLKVLNLIKANMLKFDSIPDVLVKFHNFRYFLFFLRYYLNGSRIMRMLGML